MKSEATYQQQSGFVLVVVLILLVVLSTLAGMAAMTGTRAIDEAHAEQEIFQGKLDMLSTRDTLLFMLSTQRQTIAGLTTGAYTPPIPAVELDDGGASVLPIGNEIRLDGRSYQGIGQTLFSFQDDRGLISINWAGSAMESAILTSLGAPPERTSDYSDTLQDYQDEDDLRRLNGAEQTEYAGSPLPPPANRPLTTPLELRRVMGWHDLLKSKDDAWLLNVITTSRDSSLNINTAPVEVLSLLPGMDAANAQRMVDVRNLTPFVSIYDAFATFPLNALPEDVVNIFSNRSGNLILWNRRSGTRRLQHWTLSSVPNGQAPWRIDYEIVLPRDESSSEAMAETPASPLFAPTPVAGE